MTSGFKKDSSNFKLDNQNVLHNTSTKTNMSPKDKLKLYKQKIKRLANYKPVKSFWSWFSFF